MISGPACPLIAGIDGIDVHGNSDFIPFLLDTSRNNLSIFPMFNRAMLIQSETR